MPSRRDPRELLPLTPVVLHILLALTDGEKHGYAIAQAVEQDTGAHVRMGPGTLYGSIQRMQHAGLLEESSRAPRPDDDERRRYYRATAFGRRVLALELDRLADVVRVAEERGVLRERPSQ